MLKIDRLFSSVRVRQQNGGDDWDRTSDLLNANQTLSQLSYTPIFVRLKTLLLKNSR
jgi:hypothetical protein